MIPPSTNSGGGSTISSAIGAVTRGAAKNKLTINGNESALASQVPGFGIVSEGTAANSSMIAFGQQVAGSSGIWPDTLAASQASLNQIQAQQIMKALLSSEEVYDNRGDTNKTTKDVTEGQITEAKKLLQEKLGPKIKGSTGDLNAETVIERLAKAVGGNKKFLDAVSNLSEIELREGNITELKTRFGGAAGAYYDGGANRMVIGQHSDMGTVLHEVGHALDQSDGTMDGKFEGYDAVNNLMADATTKIRNNDNYLEGLGDLTYGFDASNPDKAEELAELFRLYNTQEDKFKEHFPELADEFENMMNKDGESKQVTDEDTTTHTQETTAVAPRQGMDPLMMALILNGMLPTQMFPPTPLSPFLMGNKPMNSYPMLSRLNNVNIS